MTESKAHALLRARFEAIVVGGEVEVPLPTEAALSPPEPLFTTVAEAEAILRENPVFRFLTRVVREG